MIWYTFLLLLMLYLLYDLTKEFESVLIIWHLSNALHSLERIKIDH